MRILVVGAGGYLGRGITRELIRMGEEVTAVDRNPVRIPDGCRRSSANIFTIANPYLFYGRPDVCLYLAWQDGYRHESRSHIENLPEHWRTIQNMLEAGLPRIAVMGTVHEVGPWKGQIHSDTPMQPVTAYGIAKAALCRLTQEEAKRDGAVFLWLRGYQVIPGSEKPKSGLFARIDTAARNHAASVPLCGTERMEDFVEYDTFCRMAAATVTQEEVTGIIDLCSGKPSYVTETAKAYIRARNYNLMIQAGAYGKRSEQSVCIYGDNTKIQQILQNQKKRELADQKEQKEQKDPKDRSEKVPGLMNPGMGSATIRRSA